MKSAWSILLLLSFAAVVAVPVRADDKKPRPVKRYRVIFNSDGHGVFKDARGDLDQWIENLFGPLEDSHVDALFWCDGAGGNTANYDSRVLERNGARSGKTDPALEKLITEGNDPPGSSFAKPTSGRSMSSTRSASTTSTMRSCPRSVQRSRSNTPSG